MGGPDLELLRHWAVFFPRQANPSRCAACAFELWHPYRCHGPFCKEYEIEALVGRRPLPRTIGSRRLVMPSVGAPLYAKNKFFVRPPTQEWGASRPFALIFPHRSPRSGEYQGAFGSEVFRQTVFERKRERQQRA